jgi:hypothetical protein
MPIQTLAGNPISSTYQRVVQTDGTYLADGTGSILQTLNITASYASNAFPYTGSAGITGSLYVVGPFTASSAIITGNVIVQGTASINTLVVNQTQLSTGSNQLGDNVDDFQTLYGTVRIPTGSLTITGSVSQLSGSYRFYTTQSSGFLATVSGSQPNSDIAFNFRKVGEGVAGSRHTFIIEGTGGQDNNIYFGVSDARNAIGSTLAVKGNGSININMPSPTGNYGGVAIGGWNSSFPSLLVRGLGTTSATTALLVQNSSATPSLVVLDNGTVVVGNTVDTAYRVNISGSMYLTNGFVSDSSTVVVNKYSSGGTLMTIAGYSHYGSTGLSVSNAVGIIATATGVGVSGNNPSGVGIVASGAQVSLGFALGAILRRALIAKNTGTTGTSMYSAAALQIDGTDGGLLLPTLTTSQRNSLTAITGLSILTSGSGYTNGTYQNQSYISIIGGSGSLGRARVVVSGGSVTSVTTDTFWGNGGYGLGYQVGDIVSGSIAGGSGWTSQVTGVMIPQGLTVYNSDRKTIEVYNSSSWQPLITANYSGSVGITGSLAITGSAGSGSALTVYKSGSTVMSIQGSQGELFSITDSLSGSLFSVSNISGLPILEVFSDNTVLLGDYLDPMLITTKRVTANSGSTLIYSLPTASYDGAFFDYTIKSGSNARAGQLFGTYVSTTASYTDNSTTDIGDTSGFTFGFFISGSNMVLTGSALTSGWTVRTIIRSI